MSIHSDQTKDDLGDRIQDSNACSKDLTEKTPINFKSVSIYIYCICRKEPTAAIDRTIFDPLRHEWGE